MTKQQLSAELAERTSLSRTQAMNAIDGLMEIMSETFAQGENIYLRGFGTFRVMGRKPKLARNISKGTFVTVPAHKTVKFIPCSSLKKRIYS